ncbi:MAG: hypothetical protein HYV40_03440 [Candidatus Levybacteria bacterium]|nr:hypothetical protein [Candidatus Levybacteria bacterium]
MKKISISACFSVWVLLFIAILPNQTFAAEECKIVNPKITATLPTGKTTQDKDGKTYFPPDTKFQISGSINQNVTACLGQMPIRFVNIDITPIDGAAGKPPSVEFVQQPVTDTGGQVTSINFSAPLSLPSGGFCIGIVATGNPSWFSYDPIQPGSSGIVRFSGSDDTTVLCSTDLDVSVYIREPDPDLVSNGDFSERIYACGSIFTPKMDDGDTAATSRAYTCPQDYPCCPSFCPAIQSGEVGTPDPVRWVCGYDGSNIIKPSPTLTPPLQLCQKAGGKADSCDTALGTLNTKPGDFVTSVLAVLFSASGMIALYLIIRSGYQMMMSRGNPEAIQEARERLVAAIIGLIFILLSLVTFQVITTDLLKIPSFEP